MLNFKTVKSSYITLKYKLNFRKLAKALQTLNHPVEEENFFYTLIGIRNVFSSVRQQLGKLVIWDAL